MVIVMPGIYVAVSYLLSRRLAAAAMAGCRALVGL